MDYLRTFSSEPSVIGKRSTLKKVWDINLSLLFFSLNTLLNFFSPTFIPTVSSEVAKRQDRVMIPRRAMMILEQLIILAVVYGELAVCQKLPWAMFTYI